MTEGSRWGVRAGGLLLALVFVLSVTFLPHLDTQSIEGVGEGSPWREMGTAYGDWLEDGGEQEGYPFPIHVDEHIHWVFSSTIQRFQTLSHPDAYSGDTPQGDGISLRGSVHERGFHLALAQFQDLTGIAWLTIFQFGPMLWAGLIAVLVWAALDPWPGAPIAAALTGLMPTTVRFLGPGFLVPITFGLAWVALVLVLLPRIGRSFRGAVLALLTVFWAFFIHVIAGFVALAVLVAAIPFVVGEPKEEGMRKRLAGIGFVAALPMIWLYEAFWVEIVAEAETLSSLPLDATAFDQIGLAFMVAWILALGLVGYHRPRKRGTLFGATTLLSLVLLATIISNFYFGPRLALYDRFHQPFLLVASVPVAYLILATARALVTAVGTLSNRTKALTRRVHRRMRPTSAETQSQEEATHTSPRPTTGKNRDRIGRLARRGVVGLLALTMFVGLTSPALSAHLSEPYYHVVDKDDIDRYRWIEANIGEEHERFLAHPWKAPILTAMTGKQPHAFLRPGSSPVNGEEYIDYLTGTSNDTRWLLERDIEIVIAPRMPDSHVFEEVTEGIAVLEKEYARQMEARRWT